MLLVTGHDRIHRLPGTFQVVRCVSCGLVRTDPRPTTASLPSYYPNDYAPYRTTLVNHSASRRRGGWSSWFARILKLDARIVPATRPGRLLEIGCGSGAFLHSMKAIGWEVEGIELSTHAAEYARASGLAIQDGSLESVILPNDTYDAIVAWMVLEHLPDPVSALKRLRQAGKKDCFLAISIPDAGSWEFKIFGTRWYALHLPNHLFHFDRKSIAMVLAASGWKMTKAVWHRNPNNLLQSLRYLCEDRGWNRSGMYLKDIIDGRRHRRLRAVLGLVLGALHISGRMTIWARRI